MAALAKAQLEYNCQVDQILNRALTEEMSGRNGSSAVDQAEAVTLFAEYAIDFATQSMRQALIAAMTAMVLQQKTEQSMSETEKTRSDIV